MGDKLHSKNTLIEAYEFWEDNHSMKWADSTKKSYRKTVESVEEYMISNELEPIIENIDYGFIKQWENYLYEIFSEKSIKQKIATMASLFNFLNKLGTVNSNEFAIITINNNDNQASHSRELDIQELYEVFKAAQQLEAEGTPILLPTLVAMFTGFRSVTLTKLKVSTVNFNKSQLEFKLKENKSIKTTKQKNNKRPNNKVKELIVPIPPKLLALIEENTQDLEKNDSLLYGLRGKPLANKQMNYITKTLCTKLGWLNEYEGEEDEESELAFTPHGFRYTLSTLLYEMGVSEQAIRHVLGHSHFELGNLRLYIKTYNKQVKEIKVAQMLLEMLLFTAYEIESQFNLKIDLKTIFDSIDTHYTNALYNIEYLQYFKSLILNSAIQNLSETLQVEQLNPMQTNAVQPQSIYGNPMQMPYQFTGHPTNHMSYPNYVPVYGQIPYQQPSVQFTNPVTNMHPINFLQK
ncbi:tyrosine-type recombinase/integrase [Metasolibacillus meyeri]|uniref:tyrosine-type recombinase/integrase n=1 Tax=Metasolibacillus meyeri TaxID=1071052 RepID=UPI000D327E3A|nr:site-specific integrase [Metasolibacillus meyeri]